MDAESAPLAEALKDENISLVTGAMVERLEASPDGKTINAIHYRRNGEARKLSPKLVILSAGAINSAAILLRSAPGGLANSSDQVGRNFMNHNSAAMLAIDPRRVNDSVYQKTLSLNDYYLSDGKGGKPLGNVQLLGKINGDILRANVRLAPKFALDYMSRHAVDWYLMCEDLPDPESRIMVDGSGIVMQWRRTNMQSLTGLAKVMRENLRACGYPIVLSRPFDKRTPSHQCGTVRMGNDPAAAPLDPWCRACDHRNLFVVDGGFLPNSAAVNPALSIAAQALRVAGHIRTTDLGRMSRPVAIVTGASRGIGLAIAQSLAAAGFDIAATSIGWADDKAEIETRLRKAGADVLLHEGDIGDLDGHVPFVAAVLDRFGHIECLVNNAGIASPVRGDLLDLEPAHFDQVMSVNLRGTIFLTQAVARAMLADADDRARDDRQHHLGQRRDGVAGARRLLHLQGRPFDVDAGCWRCGSPTRASRSSRSGPASSAPT